MHKDHVTRLYAGWVRHPEFGALQTLLAHIIDALPDEPPKPPCKLWEDGAEPIADRAIGEAIEERLIDQQIEEVKAEVHRYPAGSGPWVESVRVSDYDALLAKYNAILGQRSEGTAAASGATQPPKTDWSAKINEAGEEWLSGIRHTISSEDARKLRIMKAMEDISAKDKFTNFGFRDGSWVVVGCLGTTPVNDMYSPQ